MSAPHHRHQSSLEAVLDFSSAAQPLEAEQSVRAAQIFHQIIDHCEPSQTTTQPYKRISLVRLTHEYAPSRDSFLVYFFKYMTGETSFSIALSRFVDFNDWNSERKNELALGLTDFADFLVDNFFLPLKASTRKTPQPTPASLSGSQLTHQIAGTTQRVAALREDCLIRDRHRCVISRVFDYAEAVERVGREGSDEAKDDDGKLLNDEAGTFVALEVAHILPHSLMKVTSGEPELNDSKKIALAILNMFDNGIVPLIEGPGIDRPGNALTMTMDFHRLFGGFEVYFEPATQTPHTYRIDSTRTGVLRNRILPVVRTLFLTTTRTIDPPSARFLAIHRAIALILHLSAAGWYIDRTLRDLDEVDVKADGSTDLGRLLELRLKLNGWNGAVRCA